MKENRSSKTKRIMENSSLSNQGEQKLQNGLLSEFPQFLEYPIKNNNDLQKKEEFLEDLSIKSKNSLGFSISDKSGQIFEDLNENISLSNIFVNKTKSICPSFQSPRKSKCYNRPSSQIDNSDKSGARKKIKRAQENFSTAINSKDKFNKNSWRIKKRTKEEEDKELEELLIRQQRLMLEMQKRGLKGFMILPENTMMHKHNYIKNEHKVNKKNFIEKIVNETGLKNPKKVIRRRSRALTGKCFCKNSKCLKLYCECFKSGKYCFNCYCEGCNNTEDHHQSFRKLNNNFERDLESGMKILGCTCSKSQCLNNYCSCHKQGLECSDICSCKTCNNIKSKTESKQGKICHKRPPQNFTSKKTRLKME